MSVRVGMDFDSNQWIDWEGNSPPNLLPKALWFGNLGKGLAASVTLISKNYTRTPYGLMTQVIQWASAASGGYFYWRTPAQDKLLPIIPLTTYTAVVWVRLVSGPTANIRLGLVMQDDAGIGQTNIVLTSTVDWTPIRISGTTRAADTRMRAQLTGLDADGVARQIEVTGVGIYLGSNPMINFNSGGVDTTQNTWLDLSSAYPSNLFPQALYFTSLSRLLAVGTTLVSSQQLVTTHGLNTDIIRFPCVSASEYVNWYPSTTLYSNPIPAKPSTVYTAVMWVRLNSGTAGSFRLSVITDIGGGLGTTDVALTVGGPWVPIRKVVTTTSTTNAVRMLLVNLSTDSSARQVEVTGQGFYLGSQPNIDFNTGIWDSKENITPYLLALEGDSGANDNFSQMTPIDGRLIITLDNTDKVWTPRNTASPYYGLLTSRTYVDVQIDTLENGNWISLWSGFYDSIDLTTGAASSRQAKITALQGMIYLGDSRITYQPTVNQKTSDVLRSIMKGQTIPADRFSWRLDNARLGMNTQFVPVDRYADIQDTTYVHPVAGAGISDSDSVRSFMNDLIANEGGLAFYNRSGRFVFRPRSALIDPARPTPTIVIGSDAQGAEYRYNGVQATEVEVNYLPQQIFTGVMWQTKSESPIKVDANSSKEVIVSLETAEGFKITALTLDPFNTGASTFAATIPDGDVITTLASALIPTQVVQEGARVRLVITNTLAVEVSIAAALGGTGYYAKDQQTVIVADATLLHKNAGHKKAIKLNLNQVVDETEATAVAQHCLAITENLVDGIFAVNYSFGTTLSSVSAVVRLVTAMGIEVGDLIYVTEDQSMVTSLACLVLEGKLSYSAAGGLQISLTLLPLSIVP